MQQDSTLDAMRKLAAELEQQNALLRQRLAQRHAKRAKPRDWQRQARPFARIDRLPVYPQAPVDLTAIAAAQATDRGHVWEDAVIQSYCFGYKRGGLYRHFYTGVLSALGFEYEHKWYATPDATAALKRAAGAQDARSVGD